jgi:uncharacterized protein YuzE
MSHTEKLPQESRIESYDDGPVMYLAVDPDGAWARSEFPDALMTIDYDEDHRIIGVELIGELAQDAREGLWRAVTAAKSLSDPTAVTEALAPALAMD